jgi:5-methylcytosine-specific restriction endonuclease McrA
MNNKVVYLTKPESFVGCPVSNQHDISGGYDAMTATNLSKICTKCKIEKPVSEFYKDKSRRDGLTYQCKRCYDKRKRIYYENNKIKVAEQTRIYHAENKQRINERHRISYTENKQEKCERSRKYNEEHKDDVAERSRKWQKNNPEKVKLISRKANHKRRALKRNATIEEFSPIEVLERDNYICQICGIKTRPDFKNQFHPKYPNLDHVVPLSLGGEHSRKNTQCLCRQCNIEKSNTGTGDQLRLFG